MGEYFANRFTDEKLGGYQALKDVFPEGQLYRRPIFLPKWFLRVATIGLGGGGVSLASARPVEVAKAALQLVSGKAAGAYRLPSGRAWRDFLQPSCLRGGYLRGWRT